MIDHSKRDGRVAGRFSRASLAVLLFAFVLLAASSGQA